MYIGVDVWDRQSSEDALWRDRVLSREGIRVGGKVFSSGKILSLYSGLRMFSFIDLCSYSTIMRFH